MEKYTKAQMEVIEFEAEDVITTSSGCSGVNAGKWETVHLLWLFQATRLLPRLYFSSCYSTYHDACVV